MGVDLTVRAHFACLELGCKIDVALIQIPPYTCIIEKEKVNVESRQVRRA